MFTLHSFLQTLFQFVKSIVVTVSKKMHRNAAVLTAGCMVITVISFTATGFGGGGKNALAGYIQAESDDERQAPEEDRTRLGVLAEMAGISGAFAVNAEALAEGSEAGTSQESLARVEGSGLFTEAKAQTEYMEQILQKNESLKKDSAKGRELVGYALEMDVSRQLEREKTVNTQVEQIQKEIRTRQIEETVRHAAETVRQQEEEAVRAAKRVDCSAQDYEVLLRIVQAEAGICDRRGRILVANVILNRVRSSEFPDNITDVVFQESQFSPVIDGSINQVAVTEQTIECVDLALNGEDYSEGALYFMNRSKSQSKNVSWFDGRLTYLFTHDGHEFFK